MDKEKVEVIATRAVELRDTGEQDYNAYVRAEVAGECEACQANLKAIRDAIEAAPVPVIDVTTIVKGDYEELRVVGDIVKVKIDGVWLVGTKKVK